MEYSGEYRGVKYKWEIAHEQHVVDLRFDTSLHRWSLPKWVNCRDEALDWLRKEIDKQLAEDGISLCHGISNMKKFSSAKHRGAWLR